MRFGDRIAVAVDFAVLWLHANPGDEADTLDLEYAVHGRRFTLRPPDTSRPIITVVKACCGIRLVL